MQNVFTKWGCATARRAAIREKWETRQHCSKRCASHTRLPLDFPELESSQAWKCRLRGRQTKTIDRDQFEVDVTQLASRESQLLHSQLRRLDLPPGRKVLDHRKVLEKGPNLGMKLATGRRRQGCPISKPEGGNRKNKASYGRQVQFSSTTGSPRIHSSRVINYVPITRYEHHNSPLDAATLRHKNNPGARRDPASGTPIDSNRNAAVFTKAPTTQVVYSSGREELSGTLK